jgi:NADPH:quinone reductase-like Zn-dependent oxidoreductase
MKSTNNLKPNHMKAIVYTQYGAPDVLHMQEVSRPIPNDNEVLVRVKATATNSGDWRLRKADPWAVRLFFGLTKPNRNILGGVFSGEIESIGKDVKLFNTGDEVFGSTGMRFGAYAEYLTIPEDDTLALKPDNITHREAAVIPFGGKAALHFIKKAKIKPGQKVLINGASGAVGSAAVQLAKYFGAEVTGICSTSNTAMVKALGADKVIDYTREDFSKNGETYDVIMDTVNKLPYRKMLHSISKNGILILSAAEPAEMIRGAWTSMTSKRKVITGVISEKAEDINFLKSLIETGRYKPVIDKTFPLERMAEAHAYAEKGHKRGNVSITVGQD